VKHWLRRVYNRKLLTEAEVARLSELIEEPTPKLSAYIKSIGKQQGGKVQATSDIDKDKENNTDGNRRAPTDN
jgi:hypothetical protein